MEVIVRSPVITLEMNTMRSIEFVVVPEEW